MIGGGGYSYSQGWLDKPLALILGRQEAGKASPTLVDSADKTPIRQPPAATARTDSEHVAQIEALQSRLSSQESTTRNLQSIIEDLASQVVRQQGGRVVQNNEETINDMRFEIIDLKLRLTGDTLAAMSALEEIEKNVDPESIRGKSIINNRQRLSQIPTRDQVLVLIDRLEATVSETEADIDRRISDLSKENEKTNLDSGILNALFKVKRTDASLLLESQLTSELAATIQPLRLSLLLNAHDSYLASMAVVQRAADALRDHKPSLGTSEIANVLFELSTVGFPAAFLVSASPTN